MLYHVADFGCFKRALIAFVLIEYPINLQVGTLSIIGRSNQISKEDTILWVLVVNRA